jgi:AcrR family transcriptional regulator
MSERSPRSRRNLQQRERIVAAALTLVGEHSVDALTMARLAEDVDLTAGALYRYFGSKDELIVELQLRTITRIHELFRAHRRVVAAMLPRTVALASLCEIAAAATFYLGFAEHEGSSFRMLALTIADPRPLVADVYAKSLAAPLAQLIAEVGDLFDAAVDAEAIAGGNAAERTVVLWTALHGITLAHKLDRLSSRGAGAFAAPRLSGELVRALLVGWGAAPSAVAAAQRWQHEHPIRWEQLT